MSAREDMIGAQSRLIAAALELAAAERRLPSGHAIKAVQAGDVRLALAARDLTNAVDELPPNDRPKGWALTPDGSLA